MSGPNHSPRLDERIRNRAQKLRQTAPFPERLLWSRLRNNRLGGMKFRRQHPLAGYVVDFCCESARLIVEIDGESHIVTEQKDAFRQQQIEAAGYRVIRVSNDDVLHDLDAVLQFICAEAMRRH